MRVTIVLSGVCVLLVASLGCQEQSARDGVVTGQHRAMSSAPAFVLTPYVADAAAGLPKSTEGPPVAGEPTPPEYMARQQKYLEALKVQQDQWRREGRAEIEQLRLQDELKRSILGQ